jgi:predicted nucleic acid-binding protein
VATTERRSTLVDTSVLLDLLTDGSRWAAWSTGALFDAAAEGPLLINPIVFAETSANYATVEELDQLLPEAVYSREQIPWPAAFLAGKAHAHYRRRGGTRASTLPDFFIGAHAAVAGHRLLTRDTARLRSAFPTLEIISPT